MGVHGLWRLLDTFGEVTRPEAWRGKKVAIDASIWMSQFRAQSNNEEFLEERILEGFFVRILKLLYFGIEPVFVFDGVASYSKATEQRRRTIAREEAAKTLLRRRAREILMAQVSAGQLDVSQLETKVAPATEEAKMKKKKKPVSPRKSSQDIVQEDKKATNKMHPPTQLQPPRKRTRSAIISPASVATASTTHFLHDIHEYLEDQQKGEHQVASNVLKDTSTSLFMGPRAVLAPGTQMKVGKTAQASHHYNSNPTAPPKQTHYVVDENSNENSVSNTEDESVHVISQPQSSAPLQAPSRVVHATLSSSTSSSSVNSVDIVDEDNDYERLVEEGVLDEAATKAVWERRSTSRFNKENNFSQDGGVWASHSMQLDEPHLWNPGTQWVTSGGHGSLQQPQAHESKLAEQSSSQDSDFTPVAGVACHAAAHQIQQPATKKEEERKGVNGSKASHAQQHTKPARTLPTTAPPSATTSRPVPFELISIVELLHCCGIGYIISPSESDAQCAFLNRAGLVDAVFTEDSDVLVHGANTVLRGFFSASKDVVAYRRAELLACGVDKRVLVAMALLLGCDYTTGVVGIGLLGSLDAVTSAWRQPTVPTPKKTNTGKRNTKPKADTDESKEVFELLSRWRDLARFPPTEWPGKDEDLALLQYQVSREHRHHWATLELDDSFPDRSVIDLFYSSNVDADCTSFPPVSPNWEAMKVFASARGLFKASWVLQRYELAKKTFEARREEEAKESRRDAGQRKLTDFGVETQTNEKFYYKKQSPKYAQALQRLRIMQGKKE